MLLAIACLLATTAVFEEEPLRKKLPKEEIVINNEIDERSDIVFDDAIDENTDFNDED